MTNRELPTPSMVLYQFTPFDMSIGNQLKLGEDPNLQKWIAEYMTSVITKKDLNSLGYIGTMVCCSAKGGSLEINLQFRYDDAIITKRDRASGHEIPMIDPALQALENHFFFGEVEEVSTVATQTVKAWKIKKNELKEDKSKREKNVDMLIIHCDPVLTLMAICNRSSADPKFDVKYLPIHAEDFGEEDFFAPEMFDDRVPCRVNVIAGIDDSIGEFDPTCVETNYRNVERVYVKMKRRYRQNKKAIKAAGDRSYEAQEETRKGSKKQKGQKKSKKQNISSYGSL